MQSGEIIIIIFFFKVELLISYGFLKTLQI